MRKTLIKWILLTLLIAYSAAVTAWARTEASKHSCKGIEVSIEGGRGADSVTRQGVLEELAKMPVRIVGIPVQQLDLMRIESYLAGYSNFEQVTCALTTDGLLRVSVVPMIPEVRVFSDTASYYINKEGKRIKSNANFYVDTPIVSGDFTSTFRPQDVLPVTRFIASDPELRELVSMVVARDADNIYLVPRILGHVINFGDTTRLAEKKRALFTMYHKVMPCKGWDEYDTISVRFRGQIVATRRDKTLLNHGPATDDNEVDPEEATLPDDPA